MIKYNIGDEEEHQRVNKGVSLPLKLHLEPFLCVES